MMKADMVLDIVLNSKGKKPGLSVNQVITRYVGVTGANVGYKEMRLTLDKLVGEGKISCKLDPSCPPLRYYRPEELQGCDGACADCKLMNCPQRKENASDHLLMECRGQQLCDCSKCGQAAECEREHERIMEESSSRCGL